MKPTKRAALYLRVSTGEQTVENQRRELEAAAAARGWTLGPVYADEGISGAKGRDRRPGLDQALRDAVKRKFDVLMVFAVDRLGRSLSDLVASMEELAGAKVDLFLLQQGVDTTTPAGRALFQMLGVFSEFERALIVSRVNAGIARVKATGKTKSGRPIGRPTVKPAVEAAIIERLTAGMGIGKIAAELHCGSGVVQRIRRAVSRPVGPASSPG